MIKKGFVLLLFGAVTYGLVEVLWRSYTHWSMLAAGGISFVLLCVIDARLRSRRSLLFMSVLGAAAITLVELVFGAVFNLWLGMGVWDYSSLPLDLFGQICLPFSLLWIPLSAFGILAGRFLLRNMTRF